MQPVTVVFCFNEGFCPVAAAAVGSLIAHAGAGRHYDIYVVSPDLSSSSREQLSAMTCGHDVTLQVVDFDLQAHSRHDFSYSVHTRHTFIRLFLPQLLGHLPRVLYLDADLVILADVALLFDRDLQGHAVGVVADPCDISPTDFATLLRKVGLPGMTLAEYMTQYLGLPAGALAGYFNSGVMLMDLPRFASRLERDLEELLDRRYVCSDQDLLNIVFAEDKELLEGQWNVQLKAAGDQPTTDARILHYSGRCKPCDDAHPVTVRTLPYWQAVAATPFFPAALEHYATARARAALRGMLEHVTELRQALARTAH